MLKLIQPILDSDKFRGIPKMIISQFCRGTFMNPEFATAEDLQTNIPPQTLNSQVILIVYAKWQYDCLQIQMTVSLCQ